MAVLGIETARKCDKRWTHQKTKWKFTGRETVGFCCSFRSFEHLCPVNDRFVSLRIVFYFERVRITLSNGNKIKLTESGFKFCGQNFVNLVQLGEGYLSESFLQVFQNGVPLEFPGCFRLDFRFRFGGFL